jgi:hypothetical protein
MILEHLAEEIQLMLQLVAALILLFIGAVLNYFRTLDKQTLISDIQLIQLLMSGEKVVFREDGKWVAVKNPSKSCAECVNNCMNCEHN